MFSLSSCSRLIPATGTTFGLVPVYGNDVWLRAVLAAVAAYFGFVHKRSAGGYS